MNSIPSHSYNSLRKTSLHSLRCKVMQQGAWKYNQIIKLNWGRLQEKYGVSLMQCCWEIKASLGWQDYKGSVQSGHLIIRLYSNAGVMSLRLYILADAFCNHCNRRVLKICLQRLACMSLTIVAFVPKNHLSRQCHPKARQSSDSNKTLLKTKQCTRIETAAFMRESL